MKALVISPQPFFTPRGTPYSVYYRALVAVELGVEIDLLTYGEGEDINIPNIRIIRIPRFGIFGKVKIGPSLLKFFLDICLCLRATGLLVRNRYDFIHAHEEAVFFCYFLKRLFNIKLVYDMHSSLPQQLINFKFTRSKLLIKLFEWLENSSIKTADAVITICPALAEYADKLIEDKDKHFLIENSIFEPVLIKNLSQPVNTTRDKKENSDYDFLAVSEQKHMILYAGTLEFYQGIDLLLNAFAKRQDTIPESFLLILGGNTAQVKHYQEMVDRMALTKYCRFAGRVPQSTVKQAIQSASLLVSPRIKGTNTPLKIYEQIDSGKPLLATNIYSHTQVLNDDVAFLVKPEPDDFSRGLTEALISKEKRELKVANAKQLYKEKYSRQAYKEKMSKLLCLVSNT